MKLKQKLGKQITVIHMDLADKLFAFFSTNPLLWLPISGTWENDICLGPDISLQFRLNMQEKYQKENIIYAKIEYKFLSTSLHWNSKLLLLIIIHQLKRIIKQILLTFIIGHWFSISSLWIFHQFAMIIIFSFSDSTLDSVSISLAVN